MASLTYITNSSGGHLDMALDLMQKTQASIRQCQCKVAHGADLESTRATAESARKALEQVQRDLRGVSDTEIQRDLRILQRDYACLMNRIKCAARRQPQIAPIPDSLPPKRESRSYLHFPQVKFVLKASRPEYEDRVYELRDLLERHGLLDLLRVEFKEGEGDSSPEVHFHHSTYEILGFLRYDFPEICRYCSVGYTCSRVSPLGLVGAHRVARSSSVEDSLSAEQKALIEKAERYFRDLGSKALPVKCTTNEASLAVDEELLKEVFVSKGFDGLFIGEAHQQVVAKKFLCDNLKVMKSMGVTTLFLENISYDTMQRLLDEYFASSSDTMPTLLKRRLIDMGLLNSLDTRYDYLALVQAAKAAGIRIVALDTTVCHTGKPYRLDPIPRLTMLNYIAEKIIRHEKGPGKYVALMGGDHISSHRPADKPYIPGVADLCRCPTLAIEESVLLPWERVNYDIPHHDYEYVVNFYLKRPKPK